MSDIDMTLEESIALAEKLIHGQCQTPASVWKKLLILLMHWKNVKLDYYTAGRNSHENHC